MTDHTFDPNALLETYNKALAPAMHAQAESLKSFDRLARYQYAVAGDYLDWAFAQAQAMVGAKTPAEFVAKQAELSSKMTEQVRGRVQELTIISSEAQATLTQLFNDTTAKVVELSKKAA